ncbi:MAG: hypothetical protein N2376_00500 [Clostridia bacterium]|nr:hypothetical protein [Clostridia bacterium]
MGLWNRLVLILRKVGLRTRVLVSFFILVLITLVIIGSVSYNIFHKEITGKIQSYSEQLMDQLGQNVRNKILDFEANITELSVSSEVQNYLASLMTEDVVQALQDQKRLKSYMLDRLSINKHLNSRL